MKQGRGKFAPGIPFLFLYPPRIHLLQLVDEWVCKRALEISHRSHPYCTLGASGCLAMYVVSNHGGLPFPFA